MTRRRALTGWVVLAAAIGSAPAGDPSAARAAVATDPAGRELYEDCFWVGPRGRDFTGGARAANNYPDADATYWFARFSLPEGSRLELRGRFPHARYMSLTAYSGREPGSALHDAEIAPHAGTANPFRPGARRDRRRRGYTVTVLPGPEPAAPAPNTLYAGTGAGAALVYRVYVNDRGTDVAGSTGLPRPTLVRADGSRIAGAAACRAVNAPDRTVQTTPPLTLAQYEELLRTPGLDPAVAPATAPPTFKRFFNGAYNFLGDFRPETRTTLSPPDVDGAFSNADSRYVYATVNRRFGPVLVLRGRLPTVPATSEGQRLMGRGQLRYWSLCTNETPVSGEAVDCVSDHQVELRGDRRYTIVVSRPEDRPANARRRCGVTWLDWGRQTESPLNPDYGLVILRNMLPSPRFRQAAQHVTTLGTERAVMGEHLPTPAYATTAGFEARGCRADRAGVAAHARQGAAARARPSAAARRAYRAGLRAYVHGFPAVLHRLSQATFPPNALVSVAALSTPRDRLVVLPNVDTVYTVGKLDLRDGPLVLRLPAMRDRYHVLQLMDAYTNVFGYAGTRTTGGAGGDVAIVGPDDRDAALPEGMRAIHAPTNDVLVLGRTLVRSPQEMPAVRALLERFAIGPLAAVRDGAPPTPGVVLDERPLTPRPEVPRDLSFFAAFNEILAEDPPSKAERRALAPLRRYGIGAGLSPATADLAPDVRAALRRAARDGQDHVDALVERRREASVDGWSALDPAVGDYGTDYELRAIVARLALWANTPEEATYPIAADDAAGRPLSGRHRYELRLDPPPPTSGRGFWSLTMYDADSGLHANPLRRYALGDRTERLRVAADGSVTVRLQHRRPRRGAANWLPAPRGRFSVMLRIYIPRPAVLEGRWRPPGIRCLDCG